MIKVIAKYTVSPEKINEFKKYVTELVNEATTRSHPCFS
jgi:hypothetical protein